MSWITTTPSGDVPSPRGWHAACALGDERMLVFGGCGSTEQPLYLQDTWLFDNCECEYFFRFSFFFFLLSFIFST